MNDSIIGHSKIITFFEKVIANGNLSHAYCLVGPDQIGKKTVAEYISGKILGVPAGKLKQQPDYILVEQEINEKTEKMNKNISSEQTRDLRLFLSQKSFLGGYKIAVIDMAEKMNDSSSNILLKTLEEPRGKTVLFLITRNEELLPKTIQSRCQTIFFQPVEKNLIKQYTVGCGLDEKEAEEMARLSAGLPGRVCQWIDNREEYNLYKQEMIRFVSLFNRPFYEKLSKIDDLFGDKVDHIVAREKLQNILDIWMTVLRGFMYSNTGIIPKKIKIDLSNEKLLNLSKLITEAKDFLSANIHPRLLVEQILLELP